MPEFEIFDIVSVFHRVDGFRSVDRLRGTPQIALLVHIEVRGARRSAEIDIEQIDAGGIVPVTFVILHEWLRRAAEGRSFIPSGAPFDPVAHEESGPVSALIVAFVPAEVDRNDPAVGGVGIADRRRHDALRIGEAGDGICLVFRFLQRWQKQRCQYRNDHDGYEKFNQTERGKMDSSIHEKIPSVCSNAFVAPVSYFYFQLVFQQVKYYLTIFRLLLFLLILRIWLLQVLLIRLVKLQQLKN